MNNFSFYRMAILIFLFVSVYIIFHINKPEKNRNFYDLYISDDKKYEIANNIMTYRINFNDGSIRGMSKPLSADEAEVIVSYDLSENYCDTFIKKININSDLYSNPKKIESIGNVDVYEVDAYGGSYKKNYLFFDKNGNPVVVDERYDNSKIYRVYSRFSNEYQIEYFFLKESDVSGFNKIHDAVLNSIIMKKDVFNK